MRQLESLIRLSEAIAKLYCDSEVRPHYVEDAYSLFKNTILRINKRDIEFDDHNEKHYLEKD